MIILILPLSLIEKLLFKSLGSQMPEPGWCFLVNLALDIEEVIQMLFVVLVIAKYLSEISGISDLTFVVVHLL